MVLSLLNPARILSRLSSTRVDEGQQRAAACLSRVQNEIPELLAAAVVALPSGRPLASFGRCGLRPDRAAACHAEVIRQKQQAIAALGLVDERIEDILVSLREQVHLLRVSADGSRFLYVAVSTDDTNLALARAVLQQEALL
ncbi:hypothetical protein [Hymenobacter coalescens]